MIRFVQCSNGITKFHMLWDEAIRKCIVAERMDETAERRTKTLTATNICTTTTLVSVLVSSPLSLLHKNWGLSSPLYFLKPKKVTLRNHDALCACVPSCSTSKSFDRFSLNLVLLLSLKDVLTYFRESSQKLRKVPITFVRYVCQSVCPSLSTHSALTGRIFVKFDSVGFH